MALLLLLAPVTGGQILDDLVDDGGDDFINYRAKRLFTDTSSDCLRCMSAYDTVSCQRCWSSKTNIIPFHGKRSTPVLVLATRDGQPLVRLQRSSGCGCCYMSRLSNYQCCHLCSLTAKRSSKRSAALVAAGSMNPV
ncbi:hypothetical protein C0Q70_20237 [Pomacea canaliculata]|uniref:Uncharacterized protein n=1 Tax=Pomacea canaliculata TaxID=400727 RepID=A0A2T7NF06_POMCA|nr:hypothetical protein C0Q70_20237 [Pomacea canaliculata]